jgi:hypothetical protein
MLSQERRQVFTETDCNNYHGISLLSTSYKTLLNILLSRLSPYIDEIIGDHQCGFRRKRSNTDQALSPLLFDFDFEYDIGKVQENQVGLKLNGTQQFGLMLMV